MKKLIFIPVFLLLSLTALADEGDDLGENPCPTGFYFVEDQATCYPNAKLENLQFAKSEKCGDDKLEESGSGSCYGKDSELLKDKQAFLIQKLSKRNIAASERASFSKSLGLISEFLKK